jgi:hypothetical protein
MVRKAAGVMGDGGSGRQIASEGFFRLTNHLARRMLFVGKEVER